jgi:hypothetical protein
MGGEGGVINYHYSANSNHNNKCCRLHSPCSREQRKSLLLYNDNAVTLVCKFLGAYLQQIFMGTSLFQMAFFMLKNSFSP